MMISCLSMSAIRHSSGVVLCVCVLGCVLSDSMSTVTSAPLLVNRICLLYQIQLNLYSELYYDCKKKIDGTVMIFKRNELITEKSKEDNLFETTIVLFFFLLSFVRERTLYNRCFCSFKLREPNCSFSVETNPTDLGNCFHLTDYN